MKGGVKTTAWARAQAQGLRDYIIIIDAPGHIEFLKNMVTGRGARRGRPSSTPANGRWL